MLNSNQRKQVPQTCALPLGQLSHLNKSTSYFILKPHIRKFKKFCCMYSLIRADSGDPTHACLLIGSQVCACNYTIPASVPSLSSTDSRALSMSLLFYCRISKVKTLINTCLVAFVRLSVWLLSTSAILVWKSSVSDSN